VGEGRKGGREGGREVMYLKDDALGVGPEGADGGDAVGALGRKRGREGGRERGRERSISRLTI